MKIESPLLSIPVVIEYGPPLLLSRLHCALMFLNACLETEPRMR